MHKPANLTQHTVRAGMGGLGMIFADPYRPLFEQPPTEGLSRRDFGLVEVPLVAVASRTGTRAERFRRQASGRVAPFVSCSGPQSVQDFVRQEVDAVCVAT